MKQVRHCPQSSKADDSISIMCNHEDFPQLVDIATSIEVVRQEIFEKAGKQWVSRQYLPKSSLTVEETLAAAWSMQEELQAHAGNPREKVRRGDYPITDSVLDDSFKILRQELNDMNLSLSSLDSSEVSNVATTMGLSGVQNAEEVSAVGGVLQVIEPSRRKRQRLQKHPVAAGLHKWQTDVMTKWLKEHEGNPIPDWKAIDDLSEETGLAPSRVSAWTTEAGQFLMKEKKRRQQYARETANRERGLNISGAAVNYMLPLPAELAESTVSSVSDRWVVAQNSDSAEHVSIASNLNDVDNLLVEDLIPIQEDDLLADLGEVDVEWLEDFEYMWLEDEVSNGANDHLVSGELFMDDESDRPCKRARTTSFDVTTLFLDDMHEWADEFGISVDGLGE